MNVASSNLQVVYRPVDSAQENVTVSDMLAHSSTWRICHYPIVFEIFPSNNLQVKKVGRVWVMCSADGQSHVELRRGQ